MSDLVDFVEAPGRYMEPSPGVFIAKTPRFVLVAGADGVWASVQLLAEFSTTTAALIGAWLDGEVVGAAGATPSKPRATSLGRLRASRCTRTRLLPRTRSCSLGGGRAPRHAGTNLSANDQSGPALGKLGFEKVLEFRRLEDVLSMS